MCLASKNYTARRQKKRVKNETSREKLSSFDIGNSLEKNELAYLWQTVQP